MARDLLAIPPAMGEDATKASPARVNRLSCAVDLHLHILSAAIRHFIQERGQARSAVPGSQARPAPMAVPWPRQASRSPFGLSTRARISASTPARTSGPPRRFLVSPGQVVENG